MSKILKTLLIVALVTLSTWVGVLWRWESTKRDMSVNDIVTYLVVLPLVLVGLAWALRWAWRAAAAARNVAAAGTATGASANTEAPLPSAEDASRHATVKLLSMHVCSPCGQTPKEMLVAAQEGKPRPAPFDELRGDDGMPVLCARIPDIEPNVVSELAEAAMPALREQQPAWASETVAPHVWRALAALDAPLGRVLDDLRRWTAAFSIALEAPAPPVAPEPAAGAHAMVRMLAAWPTSWSEFEHAVASAWLRLRVTRENATTIPMSRFVFDAAARSGEELWLHADGLMNALAREDRHDVLVLVACDSAISDQAVAHLQGHGRLFSLDRRPKGLVPSEGAAALALAPSTWPVAPDDDDTPPVELHRPCVQQRDQSIEADGRASGDCLKRTVEQALQAARVEAQAIGMLVCDADQHTARATELFDTTLDLLPHLTPTDDMRLLGVVMGHTGAASPLLAVAAAAEHAHTCGQPVIALAQGHAFVRLAMVARVTATTPETTSSS